MGFMIKKPDDEPGAAWPSIFVGLFVAFGGILFGQGILNELLVNVDANEFSYDTGTISGILAMPYWVNR
jgi:MFS transporter, SP family, sugar:H+ symporter